MIATLNALVDALEQHLDGELDVAETIRGSGATEYHVRRMFSSLAGMPLSEYVRRRQMTVAAGALIAGRRLLDVAATYGYGSAEAFGRAFRAVHGISPMAARRDGGPLRSQPQLRFRLTIEGTIPMDTRIVERTAFRLVGHATRVPLVHEGANPHIQAFITSIEPLEHERLKSLSTAEPAGLLQVSDGVDADYTPGSELLYLHGVARDESSPSVPSLDVIDLPSGTWAVFRSAGAHPAALQQVWASTATDWFPSNPWQLRPGPSIVAVLEHAADFSSATCELWLPVEPS